METGTFISLCLYFIVMLAIGWYAFRNTQNDVSGFMLGGRQLSPGVTALSAGASDMSGWILMGLPGALFLSGLSSIWIAIGLFIGAYCNYLLVAPRLRIYTELTDDAVTIPDFLEKRFEDRSRILRSVSALIIIVFFTLYTSSGLVAGGKLFESAFGQSYHLGVYITVSVVVIYTLIGGFMAVSLTDFVQGCIMFVALILVPTIAFLDVGTITNVKQHILSQNPNHLDLLSNTTLIGVLSAMAWGLGYFGQPHIITRFMAIRHPKDIKVARRIGMSWMAVTLVGAVGVGLIGLAYASSNNIEIKDAETIFIVLSNLLFHPLVTGFLLAAILAAIMSTISSQLLVSSSSLSEDLYQLLFKKDASQGELVLIGRAAVVLVAAIAVVLAQNPESSILNLVSNAWAGFGAAFGPLIIVCLLWSGVTRHGAIAGMLVGALTVLLWTHLNITIMEIPLSDWLYEIVPGFVLSLLSIVIVSKMTAKPNPKILSLHYQMTESLAKLK
jgi:SSS family solute:Na+ symporter/sodium/proline symporter